MSGFKMYELCGDLRNVESAYVFDFIADSKIKSHMYYFAVMTNGSCDVRRVIQTEDFMRSMQVNNINFKKINSIDSEVALAITRRICQMMDMDDIISGLNIPGLVKIDDSNFYVSKKLFLKHFSSFFLSTTDQSDSPKKYTKSSKKNPNSNK